MNTINKVLSLLVVSFVIISTILCADFYESLLVRYECYPTTQPGCNRDIIDAYPKLRYSYLNVTEATTHFYMFSNENPDNPELMHKCAGGLPPNTKFNPKCPTEIMLPGFASGVCNFAIFRELKNVRLNSGCYNVILVDYMWGNSFDLVDAKNNLKIVRDQTVIVIRKLKKRFHLTYKDFMLTGHSYGAHLAGLIGQKEQIAKILGLDPAGVLFTEHTPLSERLDAGDADCVEVVHCNAGQCLPEYFGCNFTCGTIDFWVNGGLHQQSCNMQTMRSFMKQDYIYAFFSLYPAACSHFQCLQYYRASMTPKDCEFVGVQCPNNDIFQMGGCRNCGRKGKNCAVMGGYSCDCLQEGQQFKSYYLNTKNDCPYCDNSGINTECLNCPEKSS